MSINRLHANSMDDPDSGEISHGSCIAHADYSLFDTTQEITTLWLCSSMICLRSYVTTGLK